MIVTSGWEEAYYGYFSGAGGGEGELPIVVSYASSPVAEVIYGADPEAEESPTVAIEAGCFEQIEFAGILAGSEQPELAGALIDYLLSPEVQAEFPLAMFVYPARSDVALPDAFVQQIVLAKGLEETAEVVSESLIVDGLIRARPQHR